MKILVLPSWYPPNGGKFFKDQALFLQKEQNIEMHVLANVELGWKKHWKTCLGGRWNSFFANEDGLETLRHHSRRIPLADKANAIKWMRETLRMFDIYLARYGKPDLIHVHSAIWGGWVASEIKRKYAIPYLITEHRGRFGGQSALSRTLIKDWHIPYLNAAYSNVSCIIPVSKLLIPRISEFAAPNIPFRVIPNPVDTDFFHLPYAPFDGDLTFTLVANFDKAKALDILLPAFDKVCDRHPSIRLQVVGGGYHRTEFTTLYNSLIHKQNIQLLGKQNPKGVREALWKSHAFILSSRIEAQPVSVIEAMSCGLPVICTEVVPDNIILPFNGIRVPIENIEALEDGILQLIENYAKYEASEIRQFAQREFGKSEISCKIVETYRYVLENHC